MEPGTLEGMPEGSRGSEGRNSYLLYREPTIYPQGINITSKDTRLS